MVERILGVFIFDLTGVYNELGRSPRSGDFAPARVDATNQQSFVRL